MSKETALPIKDPLDIVPSTVALPPWVAADGSGNVICAGNDPSQPGRILFVLRGPMGTREPYPPEHLADYAQFIVKAVNASCVLVAALRAIKSHSTDPQAVKVAYEALSVFDFFGPICPHDDCPHPDACDPHCKYVED